MPPNNSRLPMRRVGVWRYYTTWREFVRRFEVCQCWWAIGIQSVFAHCYDISTNLCVENTFRQSWVRTISDVSCYTSFLGKKSNIVHVNTFLKKNMFTLYIMLITGRYNIIKDRTERLVFIYYSKNLSILRLLL